MDLKEVMAVNLRRLRYDKKLTQEELAERSYGPTSSGRVSLCAVMPCDRRALLG
jgi:hypothetical protein